MKDRWTNIPEELKQLEQWVVWKVVERDGKATKPPFQTNGKLADSTDPKTWTTFEQAAAAFEKGEFEGVGFVFTEADPYCGIDLDDCVDDQGRLSIEAETVVSMFAGGSYIEYSPSGKGLHLIVKGKNPGKRKKNPQMGFEIYDKERYFTITGNLHNDSSEITELQDQVNNFYYWIFPKEKPTELEPAAGMASPAMDDSEIITRASNAKNGDKFLKLHSGDISGYDSHSEADMAFVNLLTFWTQDPAQIARIWRDSGLMREKLERDDYVFDFTIRKALQDTSETYQGKKHHATSSQETAGAIETIEGYIEQVAALESKERAFSTIYEEEILGALALLPKVELMQAKAKLSELYGRDFKARDFEKAIKIRKVQHLRLVKPGEQPQDTKIDFPSLEKLGLEYDLQQPSRWSVGEDGIWKEIVDRTTGEINWVRVGFVPLLITGRKEDIDTKAALFDLAWLHGGRWIRKTVNRRTVSVTSEITSLAEYGAPINSANAKDIIQYLAAFEATNIKDRLSYTLTTGKLGWQQEKTDVFLLGKQAYGSKDKLEFKVDGDEQRVAEGMKPEGTLGGWIEAFDKVKPYPRALSMVLASFAAPLLPIVGCPSFTLDASYKTSQGKTTALRVAASVWGNPDENSSTGIVARWNATEAAFENKLGILQGLPLFLDDTARVIRPEILEPIIYDIETGQGRGRGTVDGTNRTTKRWKTIVLSTGESPITSRCIKAGAQARVLSVWGPTFGADDPATGEMVSGLTKEVKENYGVAGQRFIEYIFDNKKLWPEWKQYYENLTEGYKADGQNSGAAAVAGRLAKYFAILQLARQLVADALCVDIPDIDTVWKDVINGLSEADKVKLAFEQVIGWAWAHEQEFLGRAYTDKNEEARQPLRGWAGSWRRERNIDLDLNFVKHKLEEVLRDFGHEPQTIIKQWAENGWLSVGKGRTVDKKVKLDGKALWMYSINHEAMDDVLGDAEELF